MKKTQNNIKSQTKKRLFFYWSGRAKDLKFLLNLKK